MDNKKKILLPQRKASVHGPHYLGNNIQNKTSQGLSENHAECHNICTEEEAQYHLLNDNFLMIGSPIMYPICAYEPLSYLPISKNKMTAQALPCYQKLPLKTLKDDEYIYVNSKQYYRILNRREKRKKLNYTPHESKLGDKQKKYLHESRHMHAINRERGKGGRFVGKKKPCTEQSSHKDEGDPNDENGKRMGPIVTTQIKREQEDDFFQVDI